MVTTQEQVEANDLRLINKPKALDRNPVWVQAIITLVLTALALITLLPILNVLAMSLSEAHAIYEHPLMLVPYSVTLDAYKYIFSTSVLLKSFGVTVFATVVGTFFNLLVTITGAYALSKTKMPGSRMLLWFCIFPMLFGPGLIPTYILLKNLHLLNSVWVLVVSGLVVPFNLILMRNFFWSIPEELEEAMRIDGASEMGILWWMIIPLSKPAIATIGLFYAVGHWNDFFTGLFFITDNTKWPLQVLLRSIVIDMNALNMRGVSTTISQDASKIMLTPENIKAASIIFAVVPILLVYPFLQKYFVKGIMLGSVKG
ncbi:carbohydrate ABC transporter permease [Paenibacillus mendelii]|uniref:Carbohydrate ABC transporter permease n=1 Tax=Paenibacillus mendelii TaxID=206163 RepID=A0ABV6J310_9BACL|nr:carbohydrate ABC transporter permease [Paenibacillus mendelii]MCQ6559360.1 carbohydrate ABC transporter permease [Paenibacillus mendelii]